jgi:hypothetical protein
MVLPVALVPWPPHILDNREKKCLSLLFRLIGKKMFTGHLKILFLNIVQYVMDVPKAIRSQIDYVFALREPQRAYRENLYKNFFGIFPTYEEFSAAFDACTENYGCIVVDSTAKTNAIEDSVFWYRGSPSPPKFILGNRNFWKLHYMFYTPPVHKLSDDDIIPALAPLYKSANPKQSDDDSAAAKEKERPRKSGRKRRRDAIVVKKRDVDGAIIIEEPAPPPSSSGASAVAPSAHPAAGPLPSLASMPDSTHRAHHQQQQQQQQQLYRQSPRPYAPVMDHRQQQPHLPSSLDTHARPSASGLHPPRPMASRPPFDFGPPRGMAPMARPPAPRVFP